MGSETDKNLTELLAESTDPAANVHLEEDGEADEEVASLLAKLDPDPPADPEPKPKQVLASKSAEIVETKVVSDDDRSQLFAVALLHNYQKVVRGTIERFQEDKEEIQEVLDFLKDRCFTDPEVDSSIVAALASTVKTKVDATSNTVRVLDAFSKFISATKNSTILGGAQSATADMLELAKLLTKQQFPDEVSEDGA